MGEEESIGKQAFNFRWATNSQKEKFAYVDDEARSLRLFVKPIRGPGGSGELQIALFRIKDGHVIDELGNVFEKGTEEDVAEAVDTYMARLGQVKKPEDIFEDSYEATRLSLRKMAKQFADE